jgi:hypothetical protein
VYISRDVIFDESVFPFENLHSNAGARLSKETLLLPEHLRNPNSGDVDCIDSHITNTRTTNEPQSVSREDVFQDTHEDAEDPGVFFQVDAPAESGTRSQADPLHASDDSAGSGPSPPATRGGGGQERLRRQMLSEPFPRRPLR